MGDAQTTAEAVIRLTETCLDALEQGGDAAVEEILRQHPEHADAVRKRLRVLTDSGLLEDGAATIPERLGEFRLLSRIGSGGMGVVYLAEQESLGRRVALKLVHPEHLYFPAARERFRREVEAIARLDHSGIAPVYMVGEEAGVPFFAMEYVTGASLDQVLEAVRSRRPERLAGTDLLRVAGLAGSSARTDTPPPDTPLPSSWVDACVAVAAQIAGAIAHAHERGVLHRDIKPSNVMVSGSGRVRLLDFGLALSEGDVRLTRSGAMIGSLPYMAPEQIRGEPRAVGPATDIYGLGVTLYEMLTLQPAYWAESAERIRVRVLEASPVAIDRLNTAVPWDVETICLTAMDPDPARRYPSMVALSEDLTRVLRREPIRARRPGAWLRLRRWMQREPAKATGLAFSAAVAIGAPLAYAILSESARARLNLAYEAEAEQRRRAEDGMADAIASVDELLAHATDAELARTPGGDLVRRRMLESTRKMYERLLARAVGRADLTERVVRTQLRLSELHRELGDKEAALAAAQAAVEAAARLDARTAKLGDLRAGARLGLVAALIDIDNLAGAVELAEAVIAELETPDAPDAGAVWRRARAARAWYKLGDAHLQARDANAAIAAGRESVNRYEALLADRDTPELRNLFADVLEFVAYSSGFHDPSADYAPLFVRAIELRRQHLDAAGADPRAEFHVGQALGSWAHVEALRGDLESGADHARQATETLRGLSDAFALRPSYATEAARMAFRWAEIVWMEDDLDGSIELLEAAIARGERDLDRLAPLPELSKQLAMLHSTLAFRFDEAGAAERCGPPMERAEALWTSLVDGPEPLFSAELQVGPFYHMWAEIELRQGRPDRARELARQACARHRRARELASRGLDQVRLGHAWLLLARVELASGDPEAAHVWALQAVREGNVQRADLERPPIDRLLRFDDLRELVEAMPGEGG